MTRTVVVGVGIMGAGIVVEAVSEDLELNDYSG
jgi:hypothetical protein